MTLAEFGSDSAEDAVAPESDRALQEDPADEARAQRRLTSY